MNISRYSVEPSGQSKVIVDPCIWIPNSTGQSMSDHVFVHFCPLLGVGTVSLNCYGRKFNRLLTG